MNRLAGALRGILLGLAFAMAVSPAAESQDLRLVERKPDPHGSPRPFRGAMNVPLRTSIYFELQGSDKSSPLSPKSVSIDLRQVSSGAVRTLIDRTGEFVAPASGWLQTRQGMAGAELKQVDQLVVYVETGITLATDTEYEVLIHRVDRKEEPKKAAASWRFRTQPKRDVRRVPLSLDLSGEPIEWHGRFFSGLCNVVFCSTDEQFGPTYALMEESRTRHPRAWSNQRDFWMTGFEYRPPGLLPQRLPNIVRERETRRVVAIDPHDRGSLIKVEDFFGHEQYGIESDRPLGGDYHAGDEVLIADGKSDARATVIEVDEEAKTVLVSKLDAPAGGWKIEYEAPLPTKESPDAPGLFPAGGCYLRKFAPHGTACFYWGRLDKEWDLLHRKHGRRLFVNFADAPGDLSIDGRSWTTVKDYAQWHGVAKEIAGHVIDRYGDGSLTFTWSVFNEPDLQAFFWRSSWDELQRYYDYTTDAILRAFEDRGYDSEKVFIGGLELGGIFGTNLRLREFLVHCSPRAEADGALSPNAAFADKRLDGKRSKRVESLCKAGGGRGAPCDFVSIHAYNNSRTMAAKLERAKVMALEIDAEHYADLWVNSHETCPEWNLPPDQAAADSYLGNGYFSTWCVDVVGRQLDRAAKDKRYAYGETLLTVWPPPYDLTAVNSISRNIRVDDDGDRQADRTVTLPNQVFHTLNLLSDMGQAFWLTRREEIDGHVVAGFASRGLNGALCIAVYAHSEEDTQSRSEGKFEVELSVAGTKFAKGQSLKLQKHTFDRENNTYFDIAQRLRKEQSTGRLTGKEANELKQKLLGATAKEQIEAIESFARLTPAGQFSLLPALAQLAENADDARVREAASKTVRQLFLTSSGKQPGLPRKDVDEIATRAKLREEQSTVAVEENGSLTLATTLRGNGVTFFVVSPKNAEID